MKPYLPIIRTGLVAAFLLFSAVLSSCGPAANQPDRPGEPKGDYSDYERVPLHAEITHVQPMTGIVVWSDNTSACKRDFVQLEFSYMLYSDVCREKDVFDWSPVVEVLDRAAARGHQCVMRFRYTYPGKKCAVPQYIKEWEGYEATSGRADGQMTEFPDWRCEELERFHMEFFRRFAERYDHDPRLAFLEVGFGLWAEYHIWDGPMKLGRTFPSYDFQDRYLRAMDGWFTDTPWCFSIDARDPAYSPISSRRELLELGFGNFDDSFMCEEYMQYNYKNWQFFGEDRYKTGPMGGEFSYYSDFDQRHCLDKEGIYGRVFEDMAALVHMTFIIGDGQPRYQTEERLEEASGALGYRFQVDDFRVKAGKGAAVQLSNVGIAPVYRDAYVAVDGVRGDFSLRGLMPGETRWIEVDAPGCSTSSRLTIECDHLVSGQRGIQYQAHIQ